jgi:hypothetical protein
MGHKKFEKQKKIISKGLLKTMSNSDPSKLHHHHLVKVSQNNISQLTLLFNSSTHVSSQQIIWSGLLNSLIF